MIRNENEYQEALKRLDAERKRIDEQRKVLAGEGLTAEVSKRLLDPMESFHQQLVEEVEAYDRLRRGEFAELTELRGLGQLLVGLRISRGMTQRQLAHALGVDESQVSRDERNEYHAITIDRAARVLNALGVGIRLHVELGADPHAGPVVNAKTTAKTPRRRAAQVA